MAAEAAGQDAVPVQPHVAGIDGDSWSMEDHERCSRDLTAWFNRVDFYIKEVNAKKCIRKRTRYHPRTKSVASLLSKWLFYGKAARSNFDAFPSAFQCELENCMFRKYEGTPECTVSVYYGSVSDDLTPSGEADPEPLDNSPDLVPSDLATIQEMNRKYVAFMDKCIAVAKAHARMRRCNVTFQKMVKFRNHIAKKAAQPL